MSLQFNYTTRCIPLWGLAVAPKYLGETNISEELNENADCMSRPARTDSYYSLGLSLKKPASKCMIL